MSNKHQHLTFIQDIVSRLANNSFLVKGWSVTLVAALFAFAAGEGVDDRLVWLATVPILAFWQLDGYFIWQERLFRELYGAVAKKTEAEIDFSMNILPYQGGRNTWNNSVFSKTLNVFYGALLSLTILAALAMNVT